MKDGFLLLLILASGSCLAFAQQPPPSDYGLGNTHLSSTSDVHNDQSFSPDINQAITDTRGATTQPQSGSPYFGGSSVSATTALSNGPSGSSETAVSTDERAAYRAAERNAQSGTQAGNTAAPVQSQNTRPQQKGTATGTSPHARAQQTGTQRVVSRIPLNQGVSTTSTPGPSTGVPRNPVKARRRMPGLQAAQPNGSQKPQSSSPPSH
jgi:hypothetical protein